MSKPLWDKGEPVDAAMHRLTVGNDHLLDRRLVGLDCFGSAAHAKMLAKIGLLTEEELAEALRGLRAILTDDAFEISPEMEDSHTAIEVRLGAVGEKIHAGRSRNDQILLVMRLFLREQGIMWLESLTSLCEAFCVRFDEIGHVPMPGYTHLQPAMPSSIGLWLHGFAEGLLEQLPIGLALLESIDSCPLGSAAGFGSPLALDRAFVAELLGFSQPQRSVVDAQNSRGRYELRFLRWACEIASLLEKFAWDCELYITHGFVSLPDALTTGSSIMPQKRNPDLLELLRGRAGRVRGAAAELEAVASKLPSNYHRDLQYTKEPLLRGSDDVAAALEMGFLVVRSLRVEEERLHAAMTPDLYAAYAAFRLVTQGIPFREAYRRVSKQPPTEVGDLAADFAPIQADAVAAMAAVRAELGEYRSQVDAWAARISACAEF